MSYQRTNRNSNSNSNSNSNMRSNSNRGRYNGSSGGRPNRGRGGRPSRGRGGRPNRGRGRYSNRRYNKKFNKTFVKKMPEIKCRTREEMKHEQEQKILKMQYYYEDNNIKPIIPTLQLNKKKSYLDKKIMILEKKVSNDGWKLQEEGNELYFTHPYSNLLFPVIYKTFYHNVEREIEGKKTIVKEIYKRVALPNFIEETDINNNSLTKRPTGSNELPWYFSEMTYKSDVMNNKLLYEVNKFTYNDFWETRRGKRREKYNIYMQKRMEKKKLYENV